MGLPQGLPAEVLISWPVPADLDIMPALKLAALDDDYEMASFVRQCNSPELRSSYRKLMSSSRDNCSYEGMLALSILGLEDRDYSGFASRVFGDTDHLKYAAFAFLAEAGMHEKLLNTDNRITDLLDSDEYLAAMVDFSTTGNVDSVETLTQCDDWQTNDAIAYFLRGQMKTHASLPVLGYILEKMNNETDNDVLTSYSWALGQCVKNLGVDGAVQVLEFCRDNMDGNDKSCFVLNAVLRYHPESGETLEMISILEELSAEDADIKKAVGRVTDFWNQQYAANNWLSSGYGREIDFYEKDSVVPAEVSGMLLPHKGTNNSLLQTISYLSQFSHDGAIVSAVLSSFLHEHPSALGLFNKLLTEKNDSDLRKGIAISMLFTEQVHSMSPLMLRCYLGSDVGGPVPEGPGTLGEMLSYYNQWGLKESVVGLMRLGSLELRTQVASFLNTQLMFNDTDDDRNNIFKMGLIFQGKTPMPTSPVLWSMSAGFDFDASTLELQFSSAADSEKEALANHLCISIANGDDRDSMKSLAKIGSLWGLMDIDKTQPIVQNMIDQSGWIQKEVGCILATNIGSKVLEGDRGAKIKDRILDLVNDSDSDVEREAKNACAELNIQFVLVNAETIRQNLINGTEDYELWVERLWEMMFNGDRQDILGLARMNALWDCLDTEEVSKKWLELANNSSWVQKEASSILLASSGTNILSSGVASEVHARIIELTSDNDSDVQREAKLACDSHSIEYV